MPAVLTSRWGLGSVTVVANSGGGVPTSPDEGTCRSSGSSRSSGGNQNRNRKTLTAPAAAAAAAGSRTSPITATGAATTTTTATAATTAAATTAAKASAPRTTAAPSPPLLSPRSSCSNGHEEEQEEQDGDGEEEPTGKTLWDCAKVLYDLVANPDPNNVFSVRGKRVIELGAGTGALSVGLARAGAASVTCTDLPCHLAYIKSTVEANIQSSSSSSSSSNSSGVESCGAGKVCRGANDSVSGENESDTGVANSNGCGGGGGGGHGGGGSDQTEVRRGSCPTDGKIHVVALRWGEEEDIAEARERSDPAVAAETAAAAAPPPPPPPSTTVRAGTLLEAGQSGLLVGAAKSRSSDNTTSVSAPTGTFGSTSAAADVDTTSTASSNSIKGPVDSPPASAMASAEVDGESTREGSGGDRARRSAAAFDVIVLSEVLYWPALDLFQVDTRDPLRRTLLGLSRPGTMVVLIYKERWPEREKEFLESCEGSFRVESIPEGLLTLPASSQEELGPGAIRAVVMVRLPKPPLAADQSF